MQNMALKLAENKSLTMSKKYSNLLLKQLTFQMLIHLFSTATITMIHLAWGSCKQI